MLGDVNMAVRQPQFFPPYIPIYKGVYIWIEDFYEKLKWTGTKVMVVRHVISQSALYLRQVNFTIRRLSVYEYA